MLWNDNSSDSRNCIKMYKRNEKRSHRLISVSSWKYLPGLATVFILSTIVTFASAQQESVVNESVVNSGVPETPLEVQGKNISITSRTSICERKFLNGKITVICKGYIEIPTDIENSKDVQVLDMSKGNHMQELKRGNLERANLGALHTLNLKDCQIRNIERGAFSGGQSLVQLDLSNNNIETLDPEVFSGLERLQTLDLHANPLHKFLDATVFPPLSSLRTLDFSHCFLNGSKVPVDMFSNLKALNTLNLEHNKFEWLDWRVFRETKQLNVAQLANNPWICDCRVYFLKDFLRERSLSVSYQNAKCPSIAELKTTSLGAKWDEVPTEEMFCSPKIENFYFTVHDSYISSTDTGDDQDDLNDNHDNTQVRLGKTVHFECKYSGFPKPKIEWFKDGKRIMESKQRRKRAELNESSNEVGNVNTNGNSIPVGNEKDSSGGSAPLKPRIQFQENAIAAGRDMQNDGKYIYVFQETLILRRIEAGDNGHYTCSVTNNIGEMDDGKTVFLNVTSPLLIGGNKRVAIWIWFLIGVLCILISILIFLITCLFWRRREKKKQEGFRKVVHEKFKDSNIDLGEFDIKTGSPNSNQTKDANIIDGATPLLDNRSENSTLVMSDSQHQQKVPPLPDVALGNATLVRNSYIFSPKPPPALHGYPTDARKEFFARQISEPYLRPASAMSLSRPPGMNAAQRRYIFANQVYQSEPVHGDQENLYAIPSREMPRSGSAMSVSAVPEYDLRRQMWLKQQYSQPQSQYGTSARVPVRRLPSTSSEPASDQMVSAFQYSTLPRRPIRLQTWSRPASPTGSTCSTYSTLSWRPNVDPRTGVISDGIGTRNTAHGGSSQSINRIPDMNGSIIGGDQGSGIESMNRAMMTPSSAGKVKSARTPRYGHSRTPSSLTRGHNDFFSFEPIQEVESSEGASNLNLDRAGGRQTPTGMPYSTQSLARGEPRYKRKKPPPISMIPANLKTPSRAFDHLKGRSVSPALRNNVVNGDQPTEEKPNNSSTATTDAPERDTVQAVANDAPNTSSIPVPVLESPIDEEVPASNPNRLSLKGPPPPPKPKRSQAQEEEHAAKLKEAASNAPTPEPGTLENKDDDKPVATSDGTVV